MSIRVAVEPTNPGQFFACCGLLELAARLWPGAEGWFVGREFCIACGGTLIELIGRLAQSEINSSLSASQLTRLGTLLSVAESKLTPADLEEKSRLKEMWKFERLHISAPFDLWVDWWRDERGERTELKTWAAKQLVADMARDMLAALKAAEWSKAPVPENLFQWVKADSLPFNFDSDLSGQPGGTSGCGWHTLSQRSTGSNARKRPQSWVPLGSGRTLSTGFMCRTTWPTKSPSHGPGGAKPASPITEPRRTCAPRT